MTDEQIKAELESRGAFNDWNTFTGERILAAVRAILSSAPPPVAVTPEPAPSWELVRHAFAMILMGATGKSRREWEDAIERGAELGVLKDLRSLLAAPVSPAPSALATPGTPGADRQGGAK